MLSRLLRAKRTVDQHAGAFFLGGLLAVGAYNLVKWREDRALALQLAAARREPRPPLPRTPPVTILVAAWNEAAMIERHLESVRHLSYPNLQYVCCAGGPDGTYHLALRYAREDTIILEQRPGEGKQAALRRGLPQATGEIIFFTDADCLLDDDSLERTLAPIIACEAEAATGMCEPLLSPSGPAPLAFLQWHRELYTTLRAPIRSPGLLGRNCAVRRDVLESSGGLQVDAPTGTDYRLARALLQSGARIRNQTTSRVRTFYPSSAPAYFHQQSRWLRNLFLHGWRTSDYGQLRPALLTVTVGATVILGTLVSCLVPVIRSAWVTLVTMALAARLRQYHAALVSTDEKPTISMSLWIPLWTALDVAVWTAVPVQLASRRLRNHW